MSIVVVAKCPVPGHCKTRLIPLLGPDDAAKLARAMLMDVLATLSTSEVSMSMTNGRIRCCSLVRLTQLPAPYQFSSIHKFLLYAPPTDVSRDLMQRILQELDDVPVADSWTLLPVEPSLQLPHSSTNRENKSSSSSSTSSSHLTPILTNALTRIRSMLSSAASSNNSHAPPDGPVVFLGMDSPQLPLDELAAALVSNNNNTRDHHSAHICPCPDGGYGLLSVPASVDAHQVFDGVLWSHSSTALSQLKALSDAHVSVRVGRLMYDIDEPNDVHDLCLRLQEQQAMSDAASQPVHNGEHDNCLFRSSSSDSGDSRTSDCPRTRQVLVELQLLDV